MARIVKEISPSASFGLYLFEEGWSLNLFGIWIPLSFLRMPRKRFESFLPSWSACIHERAVQLSWGDTTKIIHFPWAWEHVKTEVERPDGSWVRPVNSWEKDKEPDGRWEATYPYHYMLDNGEVQHANATVHVRRYTRAWRWLKWCPLVWKTSKCIDIQFDREIGERAGSWKGGCIGTGYNMKDGEVPRQTLLRMQRERRFD